MDKKWTNEPPTESGYYWCRYTGEPGCTSGARISEFDALDKVYTARLIDMGCEWWPVPIEELPV